MRGGSGRRRVAIIGGGLAGTSCAFVLRRLGVEPVLFEWADTLAWGASGNPEAQVNPRLSATRTAESDFYAMAFALAVQQFSRMKGAGFRQHGSLHLAVTEDLRARYVRTVENWGWPSEAMDYVDAARASQIAGVTIRHSALWMPDSGSVAPDALCAVYADGCETRLMSQNISLESKEKAWEVCGEAFDAVILACGLGVQDFAPTAWLPLHPVRGQLSLIEATENTKKIRCALCYGGTIAPHSGGVHVAGATFQKGDRGTDLRPKDDAEIIEKLQSALPDLSNNFLSIGGRAGVRAVAHDRVPLAGRVPDLAQWAAGGRGDLDGLYVSTAHGSHGVITSLAAAHHIAGQILGMPAVFPRPIVELLSPERFLKRARRRAEAMPGSDSALQSDLVLQKKDGGQSEEGEETDDVGDCGQKNG